MLKSFVDCARKNVICDLENRCKNYCYKVRLEQTAKYAKENGYLNIPDDILGDLSNIDDKDAILLIQDSKEGLVRHSSYRVARAIYYWYRKVMRENKKTVSVKKEECNV